ncbi:Delta(24)-sterol C-methyltransferase [Knufia peltigerae]|uniref:Delta(24)-sterol C-methyltransferase n=1 Tax=Knufia peltigerae TaxID=1002370 RepID=A0AA39CW10_9EURO|nr:Delta(24)-sterol C-methyltransferase [Knufia peltigerae]
MSSRNYPALHEKDFKKVVSEYTMHFEGTGDEDDDDDDNNNNKDQTTCPSRQQRDNNSSGREKDAVHVSDSYYEFATAAYEMNWSTRFHYAPFSPTDTLHSAQCFYEHRVALLLGLKPGMKVLDVGCGIGGPAREMARFTGCEVVGMSINQAQIDRAIRLTAEEGLTDKCTFVRGDFLNMPFAPDCFDAAFAIEATCHSPSLCAVYTETCRVLKPGATFLVSEWVLTPEFDPSNTKHVDMRRRIERGNGVVNLHTSLEAREAMLSSGFDPEHEENFANYHDYLRRRRGTAPNNQTVIEDEGGVQRRQRRRQQQITSPVLVPFSSSPSPATSSSSTWSSPPNYRPAPPSSSISTTVWASPKHREWWWMLQGRTGLATTWTDWWTTWKMSPWARRACYFLVWSLEKMGYRRARGVCEAMDTMALCVDSVAEAGREGIFSPAWWFLGRKEKKTPRDLNNIQSIAQ